MTILRHRTQLVTALQAILCPENEGNWEAVGQLVQPRLVVNGTPQHRDLFITNLQRSTVFSSKLDICVADVNSQAVAARILKTEQLPDNTGDEHQEIIFAWFTNGLLAALKTLEDVGQPNQVSPTANTSHLEELIPTSLDLEARYRDYIKSINDKTMKDNFSKFCMPVVTHNAVQKTIPEYMALIEESQDAIEGLFFDIQDLIVDSEAGRVAARLQFTGVPIKTWADAEPNGDSVVFHEHVIYGLEGGKIHRVWSVVDVEAYRKQLRRG
ncbi:polyketide cyclase [Fusarium sp. NRRL 52700]|nr:polyketide cyclase [Fusarium sp. NRRL 52700]